MMTCNAATDVRVVFLSLILAAGCAEDTSVPVGDNGGMTSLGESGGGGLPGGASAVSGGSGGADTVSGGGGAAAGDAGDDASRAGVAGQGGSGMANSGMAGADADMASAGVGGAAETEVPEGDAGTAGSGLGDDDDDSMSTVRSPGCGSASPLQSGTFTVDINGTMRTYILDVPADYDPDEAYRLVFVWHPLGGNAQQVAGNYNGLKPLSNGSAIFVAPDGLSGSNEMVNGKGWWNEGGDDMQFFTTLLERFNDGLCIDQERIFSTGFSFGGMMSYTVGFQFDVFRAIAPCSGNLTVIPHDKNNHSPLPIMAFHGDADTFVTTQSGHDALEQYLERNNCGQQTMPVSPAPCVEYQDCDAPTFWCEFSGGHAPWNEEPEAIWSFFSGF